MTYDELIATKRQEPSQHGFAPPLPLSKKLFDWQKLIVTWALKQGRAALFEDCGLGKTFQQLEWSRQVCAHSKGDVLILCPLAVADQTVREGKKFGIHAKHCRDASEVEPGITITNYERLDEFNADKFAGIVLDESSILKAFMGKTRIALTRAFAQTPYRLCCTATPAPNDFMEFGQHAEFLGVMDSNEMLSRWFINDTMNFGTYRLKGHATADFWRWVSTWAACVSMPSDIGFSDKGFVLPKLNLKTHAIAVDQVAERTEGELFRCATISATTMHKEMRLTCEPRAKAVAALVNKSREPWIVWCNTNYEADALKQQIPEAIEVRGSDTADEKEARLESFSTGKARAIITKPSIAGHGLNWQHCHNVAFVGLSYSFEEFYQAVRRTYRFGQTKPVNCHIFQAETEGAILDTVRAKMKQHEEMREQMKTAALYLRNEKDKTLAMKTTLTKTESRNWTIVHGDCVRAVSEMPDNSIHFSVYSPPFANLYIYSSDTQDMGNCDDQDAFMEQYRFLIAEKLRVTKPGCLSAVHCKNLVKYQGRDGAAGLTDFRGMIIREHEAAGWIYHSEFVIWKDPVIEMQRTKAQGLLFKQLRQDSRYSRAGMPEYVMLFRKWAEGMDAGAVEHEEGDADAWKFIGHDAPTDANGERYQKIQTWQKYASPVWSDIRQTNVLNGEIARNNADEKHICPLQLDVIERLVWLYTNKGDTVLSPFAGIGSEGFVAVKMGRKFIGCELKESYAKLACDYLKKADAEAVSLFDFAAKC